MLRKAIVSHIGLNPETQRQMMAGELEVELVPQGTLIERRAARQRHSVAANTPVESQFRRCRRHFPSVSAPMATRSYVL
jgi:coenzyme A transferase